MIKQPPPKEETVRFCVTIPYSLNERIKKATLWGPKEEMFRRLIHKLVALMDEEDEHQIFFLLLKEDTKLRLEVPDAAGGTEE